MIAIGIDPGKARAALRAALDAAKGGE